MKHFFYLFLCLFFISCENTKSNTEVSAPSADGEMVYDSVLAVKYGADEYGMHQFVVAFLYKGDNSETDSLKAIELQAAHMSNIGKLAEEGKLVLAGPFLHDGELRGLYFFNAKTVAEAEELVMTDPAVKQGHLRFEMYPWYGSAAMMGINDIHKTLSKSPEGH